VHPVPNYENKELKLDFEVNTGQWAFHKRTSDRYE